MASSLKYESLKDLELTRDEVDRIGTALKDEEFRKLLVDYVEELKDPENKKIFQQEITELEKERGNDITFINPIAGYVIKTSVNGNKKGFINICANEHVKKPTSSSMMQEGAKGLQWSLPHTLSPPREDLDKQGVRCEVYDVVFHPDTLYLAQNNKAFHNMVNTTACEAVENNFDVKLDIKNLKFPKMQYKGMPQASVIRKPLDEKPAALSPEEQSIMDKVFETMPKVERKIPKEHKQKSKNEDDSSKYTTPKYVIKHRSHIDLEEFTEHKAAKLNSATPKELVVEINLPLLKSADNIILDVTTKTVQLISEKPAKYKLNLTLPYSINQDSGNAKFNKDLKTLTVTLPVIRKEVSVADVCHDSGVDSDHGSPISSSLIDDHSDNCCSENDTELRTKVSEAFLDVNTHYVLPEYNCHMYANILAFTLHVKNVNETTLKSISNSDSFHIKFSSTGSGFYTVHYSFYLCLRGNAIDNENVSTEVWDNNVIVQVPTIPKNKTISSYYAGIDDANCTEKYLEEPAIINQVLEHSLNSDEQKEAKSDNVQTVLKIKETTDDDSSKDDSKKGEADLKRASRAIDIIGTFSESSSDELSCSYSPSKCKGILKRFSSSRRSVSRSISESSIDDVFWASSFENCHTSLDSVIPEDGEISTSFKKTVRFNDVVSRQSYRSNSSILGQKKKNQRKARNKKRAQERRHSESELSELDDRKERDMKTNDLEVNEKAVQINNDEKEERNGNDIFYFDM